MLCKWLFYSVAQLLAISEGRKPTILLSTAGFFFFFLEKDVAPTQLQPIHTWQQLHGRRDEGSLQQQQQNVICFNHRRRLCQGCGEAWLAHYKTFID